MSYNIGEFDDIYDPMNRFNEKQDDIPTIFSGKTYQIYGKEYPLESHNNKYSRLKYQKDYDEIITKFKENNNIDKQSLARQGLPEEEAEKNPRLIEFKKRTRGPFVDGIVNKLFGSNNNNKKGVVGGRRKFKKTKRKSLKKRRKTKRKSLKKRRRTRRKH